MLKIRLRRGGSRGKPSYRIVVAEARTPRDGAPVEVLGHYNPLTDPETVVVKEERVQEWLRRGAQPTERVVNILTRLGIMGKALAQEGTQKPEEAK